MDKIEKHILLRTLATKVKKKKKNHPARKGKKLLNLKFQGEIKYFFLFISVIEI
jgi:hypothetical protein